MQAEGPLANLGMIDAAALAAMRPGAALVRPPTLAARPRPGPQPPWPPTAARVQVNTARGELLDGPALAAALRVDGGVSAHLDCAPGEPFAPGEGWLAGVADLLGTRLLLAPHCAWYSREAEAEIAALAVETCVRWAAGQPLRNALN